jgi:hypothetical protein
MNRYVVRVVSADHKRVGFLRHGPVVGAGPIVRFPSRRKALAAVEMLKPGLDEGDIVDVMRVTRGLSRT